MQTLVIGNFRGGWDTSVNDEEHIAESLESLGHEVWRWQRDGSCDAPDTLDLIVVAQWSEYPDDFIPNLRRRNKNAVVVYWAFDYQSLPRQAWHERLAVDADIFLSKEMDNRTEYERLGANFKWLPQDFAPNNLHATYAKIEDEDIDVLFTGTYLPWAEERNELLKAVDEKYNLKICSINPVDWKHAGFKDVMDVMVDNNLAEMVGRAKINLSIDSITGAEGYWSDRNAQIMVSGGFCLFRYIPMSELVFGHYVEYFHTEKEMMDKIEYFLEDGESRRILADMGADYAMNNLRAANRVMQMLQIVEDYRCQKK